MSSKSTLNTLKTLSLNWPQHKIPNHTLNKINNQVSLSGICYHFHHCLLNDHVIQLLEDYCHQQKMIHHIQNQFHGEPINSTEQRAVLHHVLRQNTSSPWPTPPQYKNIALQKIKMAKIVDTIYQKKWLGYSNKPVTDVVHIGIGGSDLGPKMVTQALKAYHKNQVNIHFIANIDGHDLTDTLKNLNPHTTLFTVASKSFSTEETLVNAQSARQWLLDSGCPSNQIKSHFIGITANPKAAIKFGIAQENLLEIWDYVGGRFSLWSSIGLPIALACGMDEYNNLLLGAHEADCHFYQAHTWENIPIIMALLHFWYCNFLGFETYAILPYDHRLSLLPSYLQQAIMESNGKRVNRQGQALDYHTSKVVWGGEGTCGQHAYHQLLHQGTSKHIIDFILVKNPDHSLHEHHQRLWAHALAQSQALAHGLDQDTAYQQLVEQGLTPDQARELAPHKVIPGGKPSQLLIMDKLSPQNLGCLIALYEHQVMAQSVLLDINAYDQWGVELGKKLSGPILQAIQNKTIYNQDSNTQSLIKQFLE